MQRSSTHSKNSAILKTKATKEVKSVSSEVISNIINFSKAYQTFTLSSIKLNGIVLN